MKKILAYVVTAICLASLLAQSLSAQEDLTIPRIDMQGNGSLEKSKEYDSFKKGRHDLSFTGGIYGLLAYRPCFFPQVNLNYEYCVTDGITMDGKGSIGVGAGLGFGIAELMVGYAPITFKASYHHQVLPRLDLYGSINAGVGLIYLCFDNDGNGAECGLSASYTCGIYGGINYFLTKSFALKAEAGLGISFLNLGINFRF